MILKLILTQGTGLLWLPGGIKFFAVFYTLGNIAALARYVTSGPSGGWARCRRHSPPTRVSFWSYAAYGRSVELAVPAVSQGHDREGTAALAGIWGACGCFCLDPRVQRGHRHQPRMEGKSPPRAVSGKGTGWTSTRQSPRALVPSHEALSR